MNPPVACPDQDPRQRAIENKCCEKLLDPDIEVFKKSADERDMDFGASANKCQQRNCKNCRESCRNVQNNNLQG